jgi:hypothetical protein
VNRLRSGPASLDSARIRAAAIGLLLVAGAVQCWRYRYQMYPDGAEYVDVARQFRAVGFAGLLNGCWSPLYPILLSLPWRLAQPTPEWLYPSVQLINVFDFVAAVAAFDYLVRAVLRYRTRLALPDHVAGLSDGALTVAAYASFAVTIGFQLNVRLMSPDMIVAGVVFAVSGLLLDSQPEPERNSRWIAVGAALAIGYLAKTVMFPVSVFYLLVTLIFGAGPRWRRGALVAAVAFLAVAGPWLLALSIWKGHPTYGDTGGLMYAEWVNHQPFHWTGGPPGSGAPAHSVRRLFTNPDAFAFRWPAPVTYAPFYDPTYWNEGLRPLVSVHDQMQALGRTLRELAGIFREGLTVLGPVLVALAGLAADWPGTRRRLWDLRLVWLPAVAAIGLYMLVHIEGRLVAGQLEVLIVMMLSALAFARTRARWIDAPAAAACVLAAAVTAGPVAAGAARHTLMDLLGRGGQERATDERLADALRDNGLVAGDAIAVVGNSLDIAWAQLPGLSIVAEVGADQLPAFLAANADTQAVIMDRLVGEGVRAVIARSGDPAFDRAPWSRIAGTEFAIRRPAR